MPPPSAPQPRKLLGSSSFLSYCGCGPRCGAGIDAEVRRNLDGSIADRRRRVLVPCDRDKQLPGIIGLALLDQRQGRHFARRAEPGIAGFHQRLKTRDHLLRLKLVELERGLTNDAAFR